MSEETEILEAADTILLVDWPSRDVPETLARAGYRVVVRGGPEPDNYSSWELRDDEVVVSPVGRPPESVDIVYVHRPPGELPGIVMLAKESGASTIWYQSGRTSTGAPDPKGCALAAKASQRARALVERSGLRFIAETYIADAVRQLHG